MDENHIKVKGHVFGPQTYTIQNWFNDYKLSLENQYKLEEEDIEIYFMINLKVQRRNQNVQKCCEILVSTWNIQYGHKMDMSYTYDRNTGLVTLQAIIREKKSMFGLNDLEVPDSLQSALRNVE